MSGQVLPYDPVASPVATDAETRYRAAEAAMWAHHGALEPLERWVDVPSTGTRVRVLEHGEGRPVLFVHGGPNAGSTWAPLVGRIPGVRALVLDRPGCGLSDPLPRLAAARDLWPAMVATQAAVIERLAPGPVDVVGSSFGGGCALWLGRSRPDLVRRLVLEGVPAVEGMRPATTSGSSRRVLWGGSSLGSARRRRCSGGPSGNSVTAGWWRRAGRPGPTCAGAWR